MRKENMGSVLGSVKYGSDLNRLREGDLVSVKCPLEVHTGFERTQILKKNKNVDGTYRSVVVSGREKGIEDGAVYFFRPDNGEIYSYIGVEELVRKSSLQRA